MDPDHITLISFGYSGKVLPKDIALDVEREFYLPVVVRTGYMDLSEFYDPARRQYNGNTILFKIDEEFASDGSKTVAIFSVDLFIPILTYIYGQAFLNGRAGIASIHRLGNELYGLPKNEEVLFERFRKEVIHELGHTFGLIHCHSTTCVMRSSTYVEDIDQKSHQLCNKCRAELKTNH